MNSDAMPLASPVAASSPRVATNAPMIVASKHAPNDAMPL